MLDEKERFERHLKISDTLSETAVSIGKWLLSSLLATNGAGVWAASSSAERNTGAFLTAGWLFSAGLAFAIAAGMVTWLFWNSAARWHGHVVDQMLIKYPWNEIHQAQLEKDFGPHSERQGRIGEWSKRLTVGSAVCLALGCASLFWPWKGLP
jgi:hypothetical protein